MGGESEARMRVGGGLLVLILAGVAPGPVEPELWLGIFRAFPEARRLCRTQASGLSKTTGEFVGIHTTLYSTHREPSDVTRFYGEAHGIPWKPGDQTITVEGPEGRRLTVHPVSAAYPYCPVKPDPRDRTVIIVRDVIRERGTVP